MKKIIFIGFLFCGFIANAQTDSIRAMIDKDIRNSAINAFTNLRLNYILKAIANQIDTVSLHTGSTINLTKTLAGTSMTIFPSGGGAAVVIDSANSIRAGLLTIASWRFLDSLHRGLISLGALTDTVPISTRISTVQNSKLDTIISVNDSVVLFKINGRSSSLLIRGNASSVSGSNNFTTGYTYDGHTLTSPRNGTTAITAVIPLNDSLAAVRNVKVDSAWGKNDSTVTISINGRTRDIAFKGAPYNVKVDPTFFSVLTDGTLTYVGPTGGSVTVDPTPTVGSTVNPPSSNGTAVALNNKNENLNAINVTQHGVSINSGTDQSAAIAAIIAAGYTKLYFPAGDYRINTLLTFSSIKDLEIYGDGDKTRFYSTAVKQMFFFNGATQNLNLHDFAIESRVVDATDDPSGLIYMYTNGPTDTIHTIHIKVSLKAPFAKINGIKTISEGTYSWMYDVYHDLNIDSIGRMGDEFQNHLDRTRLRYTDCHVTGKFKDIGTVHSGTQANCAVSFSGPGDYCSVNNAIIQDVHEYAGGNPGIAIENAGNTHFTSNYNQINTVNHGFIMFYATDTANVAPLTNYWNINYNNGTVHSHIDQNNARAIVMSHSNYGQITHNILTSDSYGVYNVANHNNKFENNTLTTTLEEVVVQQDDSTHDNTFTNNILSDLGSVCCNVVIRNQGAQNKNNRFPNNILIQSDGTRGDMGNSSGATNNDTYTRQDGKVFGNYNGSTPEGNVVSEVGGQMTNNAGVIYTKTSGSAATGWAVVSGGTANLSTTRTTTTATVVGPGTPAVIPAADTSNAGVATALQIKAITDMPKVFNVGRYLPSGYVAGTTNAGPSIKAAIADAKLNGGGTIYFPLQFSPYIDSDPIDSTYQGHDCNCQIPIPIDSTVSSARTRYKFLGEIAPNFTYTGAVATTLNIPNGVIIKSTYAGTRASRVVGTAIIGTNGANLGGIGNGENINYVTVENLIFIAKNNPNGAGPEIGGVNGRHMAGLQVYNSMYALDTPGAYFSQPLRMISGFESPDCNNESNTEFKHSFAFGARYGYIVGEHVSGDQMQALLCYTGVAGKWGNHASSFGKITIHWSTNALGYVDQGSSCQATPLAAMNIDLLDVEGPGSCYPGKWYNQAYFLNDSLSRLKGHLNYWVTTCGVGGDGNATWTANGGTLMIQQALGTAPSGGSSISGLTAGRIALSTGSTSIGDDASLTMNTGTGALGVTKNQNTYTQLVVSNTTTGTASQSRILMNSDAGGLAIGARSSGTTNYSGLLANGGYLYNGGGPITAVVDNNDKFAIYTGAAPAVERFKVDGTGLFTLAPLATGNTSPTQTGLVHNLTIDANGLIGHALGGGGGGATSTGGAGDVQSSDGSGGFITNGFNVSTSGVAALTKNQNAITQYTVTNTNSGSSSQSRLLLNSDAGGIVMGAKSSGASAYGNLVANAGYLYNGGGPVAIMVDNNSSFSVSTGTAAPAANRFEINGTGAVKFNNYGAGTHTGTATYGLSVDASGNIIETTGGGGSGVTTVGTFSGSSQTNGAGISSSTITFGPADATNPGMVTTGTQSFNGTKTFGNSASTNSVFILNATSGFNANFVYQNGGANKWYFQNNATADAFKIVNSDISGNSTVYSLSQAGVPTYSALAGTGNRIAVINSSGDVTRSGYDPALFPVKIWNNSFTSTGNSNDVYTTANDGVAHNYQINVDLLVTAISSGSVSVTVTYTDNATSTTVAKTLYNQSTTPFAALTTVTNSNYPVIPASSVKPNTTITVAMTFSGTSISYNYQGTIVKLQ